jgi:hypothetical protein
MVCFGGLHGAPVFAHADFLTPSVHVALSSPSQQDPVQSLQVDPRDNGVPPAAVQEAVSYVDGLQLLLDAKQQGTFGWAHGFGVQDPPFVHAFPSAAQSPLGQHAN